MDGDNGWSKGNKHAFDECFFADLEARLAAG